MSDPNAPPVRSTAIGRGGARVLGNRTLARAPILLYRAGLGFLLGSRSLMLEHVGRKSGAARYVVLEVISHPTPDTYIVASCFDERAQWFRNLMANPKAHVTVAAHRHSPATVRRLPAPEADAVLAEYASRHPHAWAYEERRRDRDVAAARRDPGLPPVASFRWCRSGGRRTGGLVIPAVIDQQSAGANR